MDLCNSLVAVNKECSSITGGITSIEFITIEHYLKVHPKGTGNTVIYYFRRYNKFFFKNDKNEKFIIEVSAIGWQTIAWQLKRGQKFNLRVN